MVKAVGSVLVVGSCLWVAQRQSGGLRQEAEVLEALAQALERMARELERCAPEMRTLLAAGTHSAHPMVRQLFQGVALEELGEQSFEELWRRALEASGLSDRGRGLLLPLGGVLGRYDRTAEVGALTAAGADLRAEVERLRRQLTENRRLWYTLSLSTGLMTVLLLL